MNLLAYVETKSKNRNCYVDIARGCALISVVAAHVSGLYNSDSIIASALSCLYNNLGTIGVPVFLILAGYYSKKQSTPALLKRLLYIGLTWLLYGTIVYFYLYFRGQKYNYFFWMLGVQSYLYYLPIYCIFSIASNYIPKKKSIYLMLMIISLIYNIAIEIYPELGASYLNPGIWILWYSIGIVLQLSNANDCNITLSFKLGMLITTLILLFSMIFSFRFNAYFEKGYIAFEIIAILGICYISQLIPINSKLGIVLRYCGMNSLPFYILHMPVAGIVSRILYIIQIDILDIFRIPIVYILTFVAIEIIRLLTQKVNNQNLKNVVGIR